jgi:hypothetical protein
MFDECLTSIWPVFDQCLTVLGRVLQPQKSVHITPGHSRAVAAREGSGSEPPEATEPRLGGAHGRGAAPRLGATGPTGPAASGQGVPVTARVTARNAGALLRDSASPAASGRPLATQRRRPRRVARAEADGGRRRLHARWAAASSHGGRPPAALTAMGCAQPPCTPRPAGSARSRPAGVAPQPIVKTDDLTAPVIPFAPRAATTLAGECGAAARAGAAGSRGRAERPAAAGTGCFWGRRGREGVRCEGKGAGEG